MAFTNYTPYVKFRDDGWPLCPNCGEDDLWMTALDSTEWGLPTPGDAESFAAAIKAIIGCYNCGWNPSGDPDVPVRKKITNV